MRARTLKPPVYLDPCLGPAAFFSKIEVRIKDTKIDAARLEEFGYIYQSLNRRFMTAEAQRERYGTTFPRVNTSSKRIATDATLMSEELKEASVSLTFEGWDNALSRSVSFGFDGESRRNLSSLEFAGANELVFFPGVFPFNNQSNILAALLGKVVPQGFLRPSTEIYVDLFKRHPMDACIDSSKTRDSAYYSDEAADVAKPEVAITIEDLCIVYESVTPSPALLRSLSSGTMSWYVDVPKLNHREMSPGLRHVTVSMPIEAGTKGVLLFFAHERQLVYDPATKRNLNARFRFPANCTGMKLKLTGHDNLLVHEGLVNIGVPAKGSLESSNQTYHRMLCKQELYDDVFDNMFPRTTTKVSYDQVLVLNTSCYKLKDWTELTVTMTFDENASPAKTRMVVLTLQQYLFTQTGSGQWKYDLQT